MRSGNGLCGEIHQYQLNCLPEEELRECEVLAESKDPMPVSSAKNAERHFGHGSTGRIPLGVAADFDLHGVLRLRCRSLGERQTSLRMTGLI